MHTTQTAHNPEHTTPRQRARQPGMLSSSPNSDASSLAEITQRAEIDPQSLAPRDVLSLQRAIGNQAVSNLLTNTPSRKIHYAGVLQPKLTVGAANDAYEQEADRTADQVMNMTTSVNTPAAGSGSVQRHEDDELQAKILPARPLAASVTPLVQREMEEDELQAKPLLQREAEEEDLQAKSILQREADEDELQAKPLLQREAEEDELQSSPTHRSPLFGSFAPGAKFENRLAATRGGGSPLPNDTRAFMESRFGADFSRVRLHTGSEAAQLNRQVSAQAFTVGQNIYMGEGKGDLGATEGKRLLAHELTHTIQQGAATVNNTLQAKLDPATYSKDAFSAQGAKAGFKLFGKSSFAQLTKELDKYHAASDSADELNSLKRILTISDSWLGSTERSKKHKKKKLTQETLKNTLISQLKVDAQAEIDHITSHMDEATYDRLEGDTAVMAAGSTLARLLGISLATLSGLTADDLKARFIESVFVPLQMDTKADRDTGERGEIFAILGKIAAIDPNSLTKAENKALVQLVQASNLGSKISLNQSKAPEFGSGAGPEMAVQPGVPGWSANKQIAIEGNLSFQQKIDGLLTIIGQLPVGQTLLAEIGKADPTGGGHHSATAARETVLKIVPPSVSSAQRLDANGAVRYSNSAANSKIAIDPENNLLGSDPSKAAGESWRIRDAAVALFHEMIHIYIAKKGGEEFTAENDPTVKIKISDQGDLAELRIVGVRFEQDRSDGNGKDIFPFENPAFNPVTENQFRKEYARFKNLTYADLRPSYATLAGQVPIANWKDVPV